jgi:radical SAM family uncharacterized protein/radical SAM-linked protein
VKNALSEHPYAEFVHLVQKPGRYVGGEYGAVKKDWSTVRARVCLAFPDIYDIGMSHLGFKILYKILNDDPRTLAERAYAPWIDMQAELVRRGLPLVSLESARPLRDFDVVGFSLQFELTYTNVLAMLELGKIPLRASARTEDDPLILAGGPTATHPEPVAPFFDAIVIGDGEARLTEVALTWTALKERGALRAERLRALAALEGVYVPSLYATKVDPDTGLEVVDRALAADAPLPVKRTIVENLNDWPFPDDGPVGGPEAIFDRISIEIARGCTEGCRFCQAGMIYRPVRERDPDEIAKTVARAVRKTGSDEVSLTSLSTADYSCISPLIHKVAAELAPQKVSLGVSSLRAYGLEENVLDDMQRVRATGVTFAPEAGSQRMRDVVNKNVTEEQLMQTAERVFSRGWSSMKLYFMIGLPTEEESDVREIVKVGARARKVGKDVKKVLRDKGLPGAGGGGPPKVTVSVSTHVPKPHTPFQWCRVDTPDEIRKKQGWLEEEKRASGGVDLRMHDCDTSWLEAVFARGDRRLADVLEHAYAHGARFDSWEDQLKIGVWEDAFRASGVLPATYLGTLPVTARLPWDHVDVGLEEGFLAREYRKAVANRLSLPCGKAAGMFVQHTNLTDATGDERNLVCYDCGIACDMGAMREERLVYLRKLGAEEKRPAPPSPLDAPARTAPRDQKRPPVAFTQGQPRRYRFAYTKLGSSALLSHLDLIRALPRTFRRLDLPLFYSTGFHPKPDMTFGPALSLGVASLSEFVDIRLTADMDPDTLLRALSDASPEGLRFTAARRLGDRDPSVSRIVDTARFAVALPKSVLREQGGDAWLAERVVFTLGAQELKMVRTIEGIGRWIDVRAFLRTMTLETPGARAAVEAAGLLGDFSILEVDLEIRGSGAVKVSEVVAMLTGVPDFPHRAVRFALGKWRAAPADAAGAAGIAGEASNRVMNGVVVSPLELQEFRNPVSARVAVVAAADGTAPQDDSVGM